MKIYCVSSSSWRSWSFIFLHVKHLNSTKYVDCGLLMWPIWIWNAALGLRTLFLATPSSSQQHPPTSHPLLSHEKQLQQCCWTRRMWVFAVCVWTRRPAPWYVLHHEWVKTYRDDGCFQPDLSEWTRWSHSAGISTFLLVNQARDRKFWKSIKHPVKSAPHQYLVGLLLLRFQFQSEHENLRVWRNVWRSQKFPSAQPRARRF